jgi:SOS-response transcriptional repressor LexA
LKRKELRNGHASMIGLTRLQHAALEAIREHMTGHAGVPPSYDELAKGLGYRHRSSIHKVICQLEQRGAIRRLPGCSRSLEIIGTDANQYSLPPKLHQAMLLLCARHNKTAQQFVNEAVRVLLDVYATK